ncbi:alpha/beta fold hydrolase [Nocardiopsis kunsanensis]|uniref:AB hydrolase-1 domain-containing protein n=1 Tax=Nocardiopsis kunsanensis TaxID=141693 RepID=A0A919CLD6_9ACTN|nr:alpha/beta hydrolase [Nocardiopsis kunsanensis]GHD35667.1 hypothetical protein GCM10007147_42320 [Nocardiopsis kunsanensis]
MAVEMPDLRYKTDSKIDLDDGQSLYVESYDRGTETTLVFINNFYIVAPMWRTYLAKVREKHSVLLYDLENQGGSSVAEDATIDHHVETLHQLLETLGKRQVVLVGTSTSCFIAARYALSYPESVSGILLVGPSITPSAEPVRRATEKALMTSLKLGGTEALWDHLYSFVFSARTMIEMGASGYLGLRTAFMALHRQEPMLANMLSSAKYHDDFTSLASLEIPVQAVVGDQDTLWQDNQIAEAKKILDGPDQTVRVLEGLGHLPYLEDAEIFQRVLLDFMDTSRIGAATATPERVNGSTDDNGRIQRGTGEPDIQVVSAEDVAQVLRDILEHEVSMEDLKTMPLADIGVESWAFTAFLSQLEATFSFQWDFDAPAEFFESADTIANHISATKKNEREQG